MKKKLLLPLLTGVVIFGAAALCGCSLSIFDDKKDVEVTGETVQREVKVNDFTSISIYNITLDDRLVDVQIIESKENKVVISAQSSLAEAVTVTDDSNGHISVEADQDSRYLTQKCTVQVYGDKLDNVFLGLVDGKIEGDSLANNATLTVCSASTASLDSFSGEELMLTVSGASTLSAGEIDCYSFTLTEAGACSLSIKEVECEGLFVAVAGASSADMQDVTAEDGRMEISGASTCSASGKVEKIELLVSGASHADCDDLRVKGGTVSASGASDISIYVSGEVNATATGVSTVTYYGDGKVTILETDDTSSIKKK